MNGLKHPVSKFIYEKDDDGNIKVTDGNRWGLFQLDGKWIAGEIFECDPQMCGWVSGPRYANHRLDTSADKH